MSRFIKHVGVTTNTGSRVVVVFRTIPDDDNTALVVMSDSLKDRYHQDFMSTVEGVTAQQETELFKTLKTQYSRKTMLPGPLKSGTMDLMCLAGIMRPPPSPGK